MTPSEYTAIRLVQNSFCHYESPLGLIRIEEDSQGITSLKFADQVTDDMKAVSSGTFLNGTKLQLQDYFKHKRLQFDLPLSIRGSDFQKQVWAVLKDIPYGETRNYKQIAKAIGNEKAARAVGAIFCDIRFNQEYIFSYINTIYDCLFSYIFTDNIFIKKCKCTLIRCCCKPDYKSIEIYQYLTPYVINGSVAFISVLSIGTVNFF